MIEEEEVDLLLNDLVDLYGYDFTHYARASLKRRINRLWSLDRFPSFAELRYRVRSDSDYLKRFVEELTVNVTEMFRDPLFYKALRTEVLTALAAKPFIRVWHAGCSTGEEVFSMAILLKEANLLHKSLLYATDLNPEVLEAARNGIFAMGPMKQYSENYILSGGIHDFSIYYTAQYGYVKFDEELTRKMVFSTHNLVSDRSFNEFDLILCRNVLIYFDKALQERVFTLFDESLGPLSFLALGAKETIKFSSIQAKYKQIGSEKLWRKVG
ncbi:CheR family methyltransferase [Spirosoma utsteinense]|uniref:Chemotaxis protein methyltransferase CheR n=1 Tax=Spirosoma utsteinense TaxID=2585773 RepID=A0ABR6W6M1_9BACT|nr:protein-glutamate O-methyltransferase CheR [Spirosoma utsteinense]MBC3787528.1 chemotaxis protein methyltransferase CheR [Spirosoma utsteinense]MBC3792213.1 chemotaxis protein methyltransferase CheR [Spirosoma utsteinense]